MVEYDAHSESETKAAPDVMLEQYPVQSMFILASH